MDKNQLKQIAYDSVGLACDNLDFITRGYDETMSDKVCIVIDALLNVRNLIKEL